MNRVLTIAMHPSNRNVIATRFVVESVFACQIPKYCRAPRPIFEGEKDVAESVAFLVHFQADFGRQVAKLFSSEENVPIESTLAEVTDTLVAEGGITWHRIIGLLVYAIELARNDKSTANVVCEVLVRLVEERFGAWIRNHGGWYEIVTVAECEGWKRSRKGIGRRILDAVVSWLIVLLVTL